MRFTNVAVAAVLAISVAAGAASVATGQRADVATPTPAAAQALPTDYTTQMMQQMRQMMPTMATMHSGIMGLQDGRTVTQGVGIPLEDEMMIDHVEGRIAFLRAELKITKAQEAAWTNFAAAILANAKRLDALRNSVNAAVPGVPSTIQQLERQERWIEARLDGIRAIKTTLAPVYAAMSDEQKQRADELLPVHLGLIPMGVLAMMR